MAVQKKKTRKASTSKKTAGKSSTAKKAATAKKPVAKKPTKKVAAKKMAAKKTTTATSKKTVAKKKPVAKKNTAKQATASKKKTVVKKATAKKATATRKKTVVKKATTTKKKTTAAKTTASKKPATKAKKVTATKATTKSVKVVAKPKAKPKKTPAKKSTGTFEGAGLGSMGIAPYKEKKGEEYMSSDQLGHFRSILHAWKVQLMNEVDRTVSHMKDEAANFPDPTDRATQEEEFSLELRTRDRERKLLKKIEEALERITTEDYGYCEACGVDIGIRRLEARPTATMCIDCKTLAEIKERQFGG